MKRVLNGMGVALCACALLTTIGCEHIRDYSVNSFQGIMPASDFRPSGSVAPATTPSVPKPSVPAAASAAASSTK